MRKQKAGIAVGTDIRNKNICFGNSRRKQHLAVRLPEIQLILSILLPVKQPAVQLFWKFIGKSLDHLVAGFFQSSFQQVINICVILNYQDVNRIFHSASFFIISTNDLFKSAALSLHIPKSVQYLREDWISSPFSIKEITLPEYSPSSSASIVPPLLSILLRNRNINDEFILPQKLYLKYNNRQNYSLNQIILPMFL